MYMKAVEEGQTDKIRNDKQWFTKNYLGTLLKTDGEHGCWTEDKQYSMVFTSVEKIELVDLMEDEEK